MMSLHTNTRLKAYPPLINSLINDTLLECWPHFNQTLFQLIDITQFLGTLVLVFRGTLALEDSPKFFNQLGLFLTTLLRTGSWFCLPNFIQID